MQLWTYHPSCFPLDDPEVVIDYTRGRYAQPNVQASNGFRYRAVLPILHALVGTTQFVWCFTQRDRGQRVTAQLDKDLVEWELNLPLMQILAFYRVSVWEKIIWSQNDDWEHLLIAVSEGEPPPSDLSDLGALVHVPLQPTWTTCHGKLPAKYPR